jgi:hypothetical protein
MHSYRLVLLLISLLISLPAHSACPNPQLTLADACVDLVQALDQKGLLSELDIDINHPADSQTVRTLQGLIDSKPLATKAPIDSDKLELVRNQHYQAMASQAPGMWQQFLAWWASIFDSDGDQGFDASYWSQFAPSVVLAKLLFVAISALILAMTIVFLYRELKPIWQDRQMHKRYNAEDNSLSSAWPPPLDWQNPRRALAQCYTALVRHLINMKVLPAQPGYTHAELSLQFSQQSATADMSEQFASLSQQAAESLFANRELSEEALKQLVDSSELIWRANMTTARNTTGTDRTPRKTAHA